MGILHLFPDCVQRSFSMTTYQPEDICVINISSVWKERKKRKEKLVARKSSDLAQMLLVSSPKIKCFNLPEHYLFFARILLQKSWGGGGGLCLMYTCILQMYTHTHTNTSKQTYTHIPTLSEFPILLPYILPSNSFLPTISSKNKQTKHMSQYFVTQHSDGSKQEILAPGFGQWLGVRHLYCQQLL